MTAERPASPEAPLPVEATIRRARGSLLEALWHRFLDASLVSQSAALAFYALLSLFPVLLLSKRRA